MLIEYKNVDIFQDDMKVLEGVNFHVDEGEFVYLIGKVGSGKSSLLKTLYCELDLHPEHCEKAEVLGRRIVDLKRKDIPALRREMGIIFQDFQLLHDRNVFQNLRFVLRATGWKKKQDISQRIDEVLNDVGMLEKKNKMPHELSGGEQQRIAIARALLNKPKVILRLSRRARPTATRLIFRDCRGTVKWRRRSDTAARERNPALTFLGSRGRQIHPGTMLKD